MSTTTTQNTNNPKKSRKKSVGKGIGIAFIIMAILAMFLVVALIISVLVGVFVIYPKVKYNNAVDMMTDGNLVEAHEIFVELDDYKDSAEKANECKYIQATNAFNDEDYEAAYDIFVELVDYKDSANKATECKYIQATNAFNYGDYEAAYNAFSKIKDYSDSSEMAEKSLFLLHKTNLANAYVGDVVQFGAYEQDADSSNGKEIIDWVVLDIYGDSALLVSKYALDCKPYNNEKVDTTWSNCSLRKWLNYEFYQEAFTEDYQDLILPTKVATYDNPLHNTTGGTNTTDDVFLLSYDEAYFYFSSNYDRKLYPTEYALRMGVETMEESTCWWWLRTPGIYNIDTCGVHVDGTVDDLGCYVDNAQAGVRPAIWVTID